MEYVDAESTGYQFGAVLGYCGMFGIGVWLLIWGFSQRNGPTKNAGQIKMAIGGGLTVLAVLTVVATVAAPA